MKKTLLMTPKTPARIKWDNQVCMEIEILEEMTTSDAQGIMDVNETTLDDCYQSGWSAYLSASKILGYEI